MKTLHLFALLFACLFAGAQSITVTSPTAGVVWQTGYNQTITWANTAFSDNVNIEVSYDGGASWNGIATDIANTGSFVWNVNTPPANQVRINIYATQGGWPNTISDEFMVGPLILVAPNTDRNICMGDTVHLLSNATWTGGDGPVGPPPPPPALTYSWSPTYGLSDPNIANPVASPGFTTQYTCSISDGTYTVTDVVNINVSTLSGGITHISDNVYPDTLWAFGTGGCSPYTFNWTTGVTVTSDHLVINSNGPYTMQIQDPCGCKFTDTIEVGWNGPIVANAGNNTLICEGAQAVLGGSPTVAGGYGTYTYQWTPSGSLNCATCSNPTASPTATTTYRLIAQDIAGFSDTSFVTVTINKIQASIGVLSDGTLPDTLYSSVTSSCASPVFLWSNGATTPDIIISSAGTYGYTVTDNCGCAATATVGAGTSISSVITSVTPVSCFGGSNGAFTIAGSGGALPYEYSINGGTTWQTSGTFSALATGTYSFTVRDAYGNTTNSSVNVTQPQALTYTHSAINLNCSGIPTGEINIAGVGGTQPYTYLWSPINATTGHVSGLAAGIYNFTITDANLCAVSDTVVVTEPAGGGLTENNVATIIFCYGDSTGDICSNPMGGTPPYSFIWSTGAVSSCITNLASGSYSHTVTDANGCSFSATQFLGQPSSALTVTLTQTNAACSQPNGSVTANVSGGTADYVLNWSNGQVTNLAIAGTSTISNLAAGNYTVTVTDNWFCTATATVTVTQPSATPLSVQLNVTNVLCQGTQTGSICPTVTGGVTPYTFTWSNGATDSCQNNLMADIYTLTLHDANNCTIIAQDTVWQPTDTLSIQFNVTNVTCFGGSNGQICANVTGGAGGYTYSWSMGQVTQCPAGLPAGMYTVTVVDANGCAAVNAIPVNQPNPLQVSSSIISDGVYPDTVSISVIGGTPPYTYQPVPASWITFPAITQPGTYAFAVTDANGCGVVDSAVSNNIPPSITVVYPNGGETLVVGQSVPLTWTNTDTIPKVKIEVYSSISFNWITVEDSVINTNTYAFTVPNVPNTTGKVRISDPYNATVSDESDALFSIVAAGTFSVNVSSSDVICHGLNNGSISILAGGGTAPYQYSINGGVTFVSTNTFGNLGPGAYNIVVKDAANTYVYQQRTITEPTALVLNVGIVSDGTYPDTLTYTVTGGTPSYTYNPIPAWWNFYPTILADGTYGMQVTDANGCTVVDSVSSILTQSITVTYPNAGFAFPIGANINAMWTSTGPIQKVKIELYNSTTTNWTTLTDSTDNDGTYTFQIPAMANAQGKIRISNAYNPAVNDESDVLFSVYSAAFQMSIYNDTTICAGGSIVMSPYVVGGTPPYTYQWSGTGINNNTLAAPTFTPVSSSTVYSVTVTDNAGATLTDAFTLNTVANLNSVMFFNAVNGSCGKQGYIDVQLTGGAYPFTYQWSNNTSQSYIDNLPAGNYSVTVTDALGCQGTASGTISIHPYLEVAFFPATPTCTQTNISATITSNSVGPYSYKWNTGTTGNAQNVSGMAGLYTVTATDGAGCKGINGIYKPSCGSIQLTINPYNVTCAGLNNGELTVFATGGTAPYQYSINGGTTYQTGNTFTGLAGGNYTVWVKDANNTTAQFMAPVAEPAPLQAYAYINSDHVLPDTVSIVAYGGTPPYLYQPVTASWVTFPVITQPGIYTYSVTDSNACTVVDSLPSDSCFVGCVWPGDANYDGLVDNNDLLPIGLAYGATGATQQYPDNQWYAHPVYNWADTLANGTNFKHSDCNGNGVVNADDTLAITLNYGLNHPRSGADEPRGGVPMLRVQMVPDTLADGQTVIAHLLLGDAQNTATNVYGLAFTFNYDVDVVDSTEVSIQFNNNSWLCNNAADHIDIDKKFYGPGMIKTALTRIDQQTRSGSGEIGNVSMKITTGNINGKNLAYYAMNCYITDLVVIDNNGNLLAVDAGADTATIEYEPSGISQLSLSNGVGIYPNPATHVLHITSKANAIQQITVTNLLGEVVLQSNTEATQQTTINTAQLAQGVYVIRILAGSSEFTGRFTKQ